MTSNIKTKIDELSDAIRLLRDKVMEIVETADDDDQYITAVNTKRLLRDGLRNLEDLAVAVELTEELLQA